MSTEIHVLVPLTKILWQISYTFRGFCVRNAVKDKKKNVPPRVSRKTACLEPQYCITDHEHKERAYPCQKQKIGHTQISLIKLANYSYIGPLLSREY